MNLVTYRRRAGLMLGASVGLVYGLVSQFINPLALPGIPLYQPAPGPIVNLIWMTLFGAAVGLLAAWPESSWAGSFFGGILSAVTMDVINISQAHWSPEAAAGLLVTALFLLLPLTGMVVALVAILRWATNRQADSCRDHDPIGRRLVPLLIVGALTVGAGCFTLYRSEARILLRRTDDFLRAAAASDATGAAIPAALMTEDAGDYRAHSRAPYTLAWTNSDLNRFRIPRPSGNFDFHSVVIARYADHWMLVCLYTDVDAEPVCKGFPPGEL